MFARIVSQGGRAASIRAVAICISSALIVIGTLISPLRNAAADPTTYRLRGGASPLPQAGADEPDVTNELAARLVQASGNPALEAWQRDFMRNATPKRPKGDLASGDWSSIPPPSQRWEHTAVYDPVRDRMVVFGGSGGYPVYFNTVWVLSLSGDPSWTALVPAGTPPSERLYPTAIYDPKRDRMLVFGGQDNSGGATNGLRNDVWALSLAGDPVWTELAPTGIPPSPRQQQTAIYDPVRDRMVVFGGANTTTTLNDVWALSLAGDPTWGPLVPSGSPPSARLDHTAIFDPVRDRMVVFGGAGDQGWLNDVWELSFSGDPTWSPLTCHGTPPSQRAGHTAIYDPVRDQMLVFGGMDGFCRNDVWTLSFSGNPTWSALAPVGILPLERRAHIAIYDPVRDRLVVFAGYSYAGAPPVERFLNDVWALSLSAPTWSELTHTGAPPSGRFAHTAIFDWVRDQMVVFAGRDNASPPHEPRYKDVWALSLGGENPTWSALVATGPGSTPTYREAHAAIYDPVGDRMVVFGGFDGNFYLSDTWALSLARGPTWSRLADAPAPGRAGHTAIYDAVRDRMVVFGGYGSSGYNDVWALSLSDNPTWSPLTCHGTPPSRRAGHTAIYDWAHDRMVVFGGWEYPNYDLCNDVWALSLSDLSWSKLVPAGVPPSPREGHAAICDPVRDRMVVFGGYGPAGILINDLWALSFSGTPTWGALAPTGALPHERTGQTAIYDGIRDRMVVFGGVYGEFYGGACYNDVWALTWGTPGVFVPRDGPGRAMLAAPRPNPSRAETVVDFELGEPARVALDLFDMQGRRVKRIAGGWFAAGAHSTTWRGDDDRGRALSSAVYIVRLQAGDTQLTRRIVLVH